MMMTTTMMMIMMKMMMKIMMAMLLIEMIIVAFYDNEAVCLILHTGMLPASHCHVMCSGWWLGLVAGVERVLCHVHGDWGERSHEEL